MPTITALLGPTNTGKTHRALERMLEHASGAIGVPLRLLAREVYDRLTTRVGESQVALVTGEEKRVPPRPRYWVCTVEAMPDDLHVDFVAIDEVQLAAHDQRGHVFTDKLLRARGAKETWFLGADTMRPMVQHLVPEAEIARLPRLSKLTHAGVTSLAATPKRSAVVAFSAEKVFELAERLRAKKGGAAVVLGVLSPRARNAQVAMFQAGEVDHLVATDAIGMGLNLDVLHVAFAALRKFDGREARELDPAEIGQIAGRAGRHTRDGTFGSIAPLEIARDVVRMVEGHRFSPVSRVRWRSAALDFSSPEALVASLRVRPRDERLRLDEEGEDLAALIALARLPEIASRAHDEARLRLLWDVCRVPDYRKLLFESHVALLASLYAQLVDDGAVHEDAIAARIHELAIAEGDIDTLTARLASVRTWSYVANQARWLRDATHWQEQTRDVEDRLSDALHAKLVERFVQRSVKRAVGANVIALPRAPKVDPRHPFAALAALRAEIAGEPPPELDAREVFVESIVDAPHEAFSLDDAVRIRFEGRPLGQLVRGATLLAPDVRPWSLDELGAGARARIVRRLVAFARDMVEELLAPLRTLPADLSSHARGLVYQLEQGLGTVRTRDARAQIDALDARERAAFEAAGVRFGARSTFVRSLLRNEAIARRALLAQLFFDDAPRAPRPSAVSMPIGPRTDARACVAIGFLPYGRRAVRCDVVENVHAALRSEEPPARERLASWLGVPQREVERVLEAIIEET